MVGYAGGRLARELGIRAGMRVGLDDPPPEFVGLQLMPVPDGVSMHTRIAGNMDVVIGFYRDLATLDRRLPVMRRRIDEGGCVWIAWPRPRSRIPSDLGPDPIREAARTVGMVDDGTCAIDDLWTAIRLVPAAEDG